ncbi:MAG: hypothetical protein RIQ53_3239 [Pseudomonadota bacterium]|jgi:glycosyltransferase involved in cell wall biosynthesis
MSEHPNAAALPGDPHDHPPGRPVIVDVTELMAWQGPAVGIVRVVQEIAARVLQDRPDALFIRYEHACEDLVPVSAQALRERLARSDRVRRPPPRPEGRWPDRWRRLKARLCPAALLRARERWRLRRARRRWPALDLPRHAPFIFAGFTDHPPRIARCAALIDTLQLQPVFYCHDLIPLRLPNVVSTHTATHFPRMIETFVRDGAVVLCNSRCTQADVAAWAAPRGVRLRQLQTLILGFEVRTSADPRPSRPEVAALLGQDFLLYVSTIEKRKNHDVLYKAWLMLLERGVTDLPKLVFVGAEGWIIGDLMHDLRHDPRIRPHVVLLHQLPDEDLSLLYRHCLFTLYPSIYEGWGLPVSESLLNGKFCLASDQGSLPEAGAGLAEHLPPYDTRAWADRIEHHHRDRAGLRAIEARIRSDYTGRRWSTFSAEFMQQLRALDAG